MTSIVQLSLSIVYAADFDDATKFMFVGKDSQEYGSPMSLLYLLSCYVADDDFLQRQDDNITLPTACSSPLHAWLQFVSAVPVCTFNATPAVVVKPAKSGRKGSLRIIFVPKEDLSAGLLSLCK